MSAESNQIDTSGLYTDARLLSGHPSEKPGKTDGSSKSSGKTIGGIILIFLAIIAYFTLTSGVVWKYGSNTGNDGRTVQSGAAAQNAQAPKAKIVRAGVVTLGPEGFTIDKRDEYGRPYHVRTEIISGFDAICEISDPEGHVKPQVFRAGVPRNEKPDRVTLPDSVKLPTYRIIKAGSTPTVMVYELIDKR